MGGALAAFLGFELKTVLKVHSRETKEEFWGACFTLPALLLLLLLRM